MKSNTQKKESVIDKFWSKHRNTVFVVKPTTDKSEPKAKVKRKIKSNDNK